MKNPLDKTYSMTSIVFLLGALIFGLCVVIAGAHLAPKGRVSCASFSTWEDARGAYVLGATWLDGDADGVPCERLKNPNAF